ncbi:MAG: tetratricopeptide repeat protein [Nitrospirae bacterium]|nr:tetratricopeptide repeat protein [Nitrospirota bacterium]
MKWKIFLIIAVISTAAYINSLQNSFHFDDQHYILENPYIRDLSNIPSFFISPKYSSFEKGFTSHYRPLLVTSYALNYAVGGLNPAGYHVVNLLFHVGAAFLVFLIVEAMLSSSEQVAGSRKNVGELGNSEQATRSRFKDLPATCYLLPATSFIALAAALIFAVHPFNSEVVNYITARSSVMCSFFYLLAFYFWVLFRSKKTSYLYLSSLLAFVLAMLTKEIAITLPVMLFLYDCYYPPLLSSPHKGGREKESRYLLPDLDRPKGLSLLLRATYSLSYLPYILLVIIPYLAYRSLVYGSIAGSWNRDLYTNLLTQSKVLLKYLQLLFFPSGLTIEHDIRISSVFFDTAVIITIVSILVIIGIAYLLFRLGGIWKLVSFFIPWFFITLLPTTLIPLNAILQENRGYLAGIAFAVFAGICISKLPRRLLLPVLVFLALVYSFLTVQRNLAWKDDYSLWADAVAKAPQSARAHDNLGLAYIGKGECDLALAEFNRTLELHLGYYLAYYNAGVVYQLQGKLDMAVSSYEECIKINPSYFRAYFNVGIVYKKRGELDRAIAAYEKAVSLDPRHPFVYNNLGVALMEKGDLKQAEVVFKKAIQIYAGYDKAYYNLGNLYYSVKDYGRAAEAYGTALKIRPEHGDANEMLRLTRAKLGSK